MDLQYLNISYFISRPDALIARHYKPQGSNLSTVVTY